MYHPTTLTSMAEQRQDDLLRDAARSRSHDRTQHEKRASQGVLTGFRQAHPRTVTATATVLLAIGAAAAL